MTALAEGRESLEPARAAGRGISGLTCVDSSQEPPERGAGPGLPKLLTASRFFPTKELGFQTEVTVTAHLNPSSSPALGARGPPEAVGKSTCQVVGDGLPWAATV